ncbi:3-oxoadipate enol-lactonase [Maritimibacter sp. 55A14]|uniref:3-oxoadipate enol-lactonase n=1 Tax=Maritimibacter sp. 55A14 TaxID=2174844 RepID=UPI000D6075F1|nr:3-oxoadipate enol-lactonase [Maritimibacter sp. 55A14]PWE32107.1 3-oxoadipate enol-lactonase [Maritimibacter sp. 55A14]
MQMIDLGDVRLHCVETGTPDGAPLVFANSLGTDLRIWDRVVDRMPRELHIVRYDMRGHGLSSCPGGPYAMGALVRDAERLLDRLEVRDCVFVGLSIGGMVAQGLAVKRLDQIRALVLSNTAAKIGTAEAWQDRIAVVEKDGIAALAEPVLERWFSARFRREHPAELEGWRNMLTRQPAQGYAGCCAAIAGTDFYTPTSGLTLPTLAIAGSEDGATPPDLVRETAGLIHGAQFELIRGAGHIPCVEAPERYAELLEGFLREIGHL